MRAALLGSGGPVLGREYPLDADLVTIGRRDENAIVIKDPTVSRKHAEIRREGDDFLIVDKNSTSGVLLNGVPISGEQRLKDGDRLGIGMSAVFLVQLQPAEETTVAFSQPRLDDRERTQFITRTELDDPRGIPAESPPAAASAAPIPTPPREIPSAPRDTPTREDPTFSPASAPTPPPMYEAPPAAPRPAAPSFSLPTTGPTIPAPTHSAAPPPPFSAAPPPPQYTPPQYTPPPPPSGGPGTASWGAQPSASTSAVASPAKSRRGLVIGLVLLLLLIVVALAIIGFVIVRR